MSSLLDILHQRSAPEPDGPAAQQPVAVDSAPPIELHLAIDNGPAPVHADEPATGGADDRGIADVPAGAAGMGAAIDPFATLARTFAEAHGGNRPSTATALRDRARRGTLWLAGGLGLIVVAAGIAASLLRPADDPVVISLPQPDAREASAGPATSSATPAMTTPATPPATSSTTALPTPSPRSADRRAGTTRTTQSAATDADPDWYDTPAIGSSPAGRDTGGEAAAEPIRITRGTTASPLFPTLQAAWTAFQAADFARAETLYREVHAADANNTDALLGLAALAVRNGRNDEAIGFYRNVLRADPANAAALGALSTLPGGTAGMESLDESALKSLLRDQPSAANLQFALGLRYVADNRWPDAQQAFFNAARNDPANADYAYNLAVSLDRLGQRAAAADWYQRALKLATASALFDPARARERLADLQAAGH